MEAGHLLLILLGVSLMVLAGAIRRRSARRIEEKLAQPTHPASAEQAEARGRSDA